MRELKKAFLRDAQAQLDALVRAVEEKKTFRKAVEANRDAQAQIDALIRARAVEETEALRKAVEANRDAQAELDALIRACAVPRDTHEETSGPREFERQPLPPKPARTFFISATALVVLAFGIGGGGLFLADALTGPDEGAKVTEVTAPGLPSPQPRPARPSKKSHPANSRARWFRASRPRRARLQVPPSVAMWQETPRMGRLRACPDRASRSPR